MGSDKGTPDEAPVHKVTVSPFWMDRYEVVQEEFKKYQRPDPSHFKGPRSRWSRSIGPTRPATATTAPRPKASSRATTRRPGSATSTPTAIGCPRRPNGSMPAGPAPAPNTASATARASWRRMPGVRRIPRRPRTPSGRSSPTPGACTTCTATSPSGATTATPRTTISRVPTRTRAGPPRDASGSFAAGRGIPAPAVAGPRIARAAFRSMIRAWRMMRSDFAA